MSSQWALYPLALLVLWKQNSLVPQTVAENHCVVNTVLDIVEGTEEDSI